MSLTILLYNDPTSKTLRISEIREYLAHLLEHATVEVRGEFFSHHVAVNTAALVEGLARSRVKSLTKTDEQPPPLLGEISFEGRALNDPNLVSAGIVYDGPKLMGICRDLIPEQERTLSNLHLVFTPRFFGDYSSPDGRFHGRVILCGYPCLISTTGIVEAPAKPKGFYEERRAHQALSSGVPLELVKEKYRGQFIDYDDPRLTEVMKGYALQGLFYHLTGNPFCGDRACRLFNAHWQEEVLQAQLGDKPDLCETHRNRLASMKEELRRWS